MKPQSGTSREQWVVSRVSGVVQLSLEMWVRVREVGREGEQGETQHTSSLDLGQADTSLPPPEW